MKIKFNINDFDYKLSTDKIADFPLKDRAESKLLFFDGYDIYHNQFKNISQFLPSGSLIVFNKTKVIAARIFVKKETGGKVELLLFEPAGNKRDYQENLSSFDSVEWNCIIGGKRVFDGMILTAESSHLLLKASIIEKNGNEALVKFTWNKKISFSEVVNSLGHIPLPPYIKREDILEDKSNYQTVYAKNEGSVAAPTAGLHFTKQILQELNEKQIIESEVTLHVGLGTFLPVSSENISEHKMHEERIIIRTGEIKKILNFLLYQCKTELFVVTGTTSLRTIESLFWHAYKFSLEKVNPEKINIEQWYPYQFNPCRKDIIDSLENLLFTLNENNIDEIEGSTSLMIVPGYKFHIVDALITNFHMPKSTLLMLVSAFVGDENRRKIYNNALQNNYRFLSYGDASLLLKNL